MLHVFAPYFLLHGVGSIYYLKVGGGGINDRQHVGSRCLASSTVCPLLVVVSVMVGVIDIKSEIRLVDLY